MTAAGLVGMRFNTIGVSDGISMGTDGMSYSLQSRDLIADSIETVMGAQWYDALHRAPRLRQEHARLPDGDGPAQPPVAHGLRRHDPRRLHAAASQARHRLARSSATASSSPARSPKKSAREIVRCSLSRRRRLRRHVHRQHDGLGDRSAGHVAALQLVDPRRRSAQARRMRRRRQGDPQPARTRPQAARHHDPRGVRERDGRRDGPRRLDQRRAAPDRHGPRGRRAADDRRLPEASATASRSSPTSSRAAST